MLQAGATGRWIRAYWFRLSEKQGCLAKSFSPALTLLLKMFPCTVVFVLLLSCVKCKTSTFILNLMRLLLNPSLLLIPQRPEDSFRFIAHPHYRVHDLLDEIRCAFRSQQCLPCQADFVNDGINVTHQWE